MKKIIFSNNELWLKFWYWLSFLYFNKLFNFLKYISNFKKLNNLLIFKLIINTILLKKLLNNHLELKKINNINNTIQKGYKIKNLGIYIRNFLKNKNIINMTTKYCYLIMRFKRKNLFLTLLNNDGNVFCKTNIGSCGFKKKVKYTGYAIKRTSRRFSKKILGSFIKTIFLVNKLCNKKLYKIKELIFIKKKLNIIKNKKNKKKRKKIKKNNIFIKKKLLKKKK